MSEKEMTKAEFDKREKWLIDEIEETKKHIKMAQDNRDESLVILYFIASTHGAKDFHNIDNILKVFRQLSGELLKILKGYRSDLCKLRGE